MAKRLRNSRKKQLRKAKKAKVSGLERGGGGSFEGGLPGFEAPELEIRAAQKKDFPKLQESMRASKAKEKGLEQRVPSFEGSWHSFEEKEALEEEKEAPKKKRSKRLSQKELRQAFLKDLAKKKRKQAAKRSKRVSDRARLLRKKRALKSRKREAQKPT